MKRQSENLVVSYIFPLCIAVTVWLFGWIVLWNLLSDYESLPRNSPGVWFDLLFWFCLLAVNGLLGPLLILKYSMSIHVVGKRLIVWRFFGLVKKEYLFQQISAFEMTSSGRKVSLATLSFENGENLTISGYAARFQELCTLLTMQTEEVPGR